MQYIKRLQTEQIYQALARNKSVLLLGARQTGKTTLLEHFENELKISFVQPDVRQRYEKNPSILRGELEVLPQKNEMLPLVILDEVQRVPIILDVVQDLIDRKKANFILTGSSARKLRRNKNVNLLPGRIVALRLDPFVLTELHVSDVALRLLYGALPGIVSVENSSQREIDLRSYVTIYLEEEVRAEAIVRNLAPFARFLEYAASESGKIVNFRKLSQEIGVSHTTIASYYQVLEDCLIVERLEPLIHTKTRRRLIQSQKYLFFDLGVRRLAAREGLELPREYLGVLFEQFVGLELLRCARLSNKNIQIKFWRDSAGPEVDFIIIEGNQYTPVEVKLGDTISQHDIRYLQMFLAEYESAKVGYVICQAPRKRKLTEKIIALPWQDIDTL